MRRFPLLLAVGFVATGVVMACGLAACGGGGGGEGAGDDDPAQTCAALERLAASAQPFEQANVADPEAFEDALSDAVSAYTDELDALREVAPDELQDPIDELERAMSKHDFADALAARGPLDAYAATNCSVAPSTTAATTATSEPGG